MPPTKWLRSASALVATSAYALLASALTWPLPRYFQTHLLGDTSGDVGVYVWNLWIFRHELVEHGNFPMSTDHVFTYTDGIDFALHTLSVRASLANRRDVPLDGPLRVILSRPSSFLSNLRATNATSSDAEGATWVVPLGVGGALPARGRSSEWLMQWTFSGNPPVGPKGSLINAEVRVHRLR